MSSFNFVTENLGRLEDNLASLAVNSVLHTRDEWITKMYPSVPTAAKGLARIQPVFGKKTVFNGLGPFLAKTAETSNSATVMQAVTSSLKKPSLPKKANEQKKDSGKTQGAIQDTECPQAFDYHSTNPFLRSCVYQTRWW